MLDNPQIEHSNLCTRSGLPVMLFAYFDNQEPNYFGVYLSQGVWYTATWYKDGSGFGKDRPSGCDLIVLDEDKKSETTA